jgi:hypothetical protein
MKGWNARHIAAAAVTFGVGLLIAPTASQAIGGSLATIVDQATSATAKVTSDGALRVQSQPGMDPALQFNSSFPWTVGPSRAVLKNFSVPAPRRVAITSMTVANTGTAGSEVALMIYVRVSGPGTCATLDKGTTGFVAQQVRSVYVPAHQTVDIDFGGVPVYGQAPGAGQLSCVAWQVLSPSPFSLDLGVTGFRA